MVPGLALRVSWICLLFSSAAGFPATKGDYKYPYTSSGGPGSSNLPSGGSRPPLMSMPQPEAPAKKTSSSSGVRAPSVPAVSSGGYKPNRFMAYDSSSSGAPGSQAEISHIRPPVWPVQPLPGPGAAGNMAATSRSDSPRYANAPAWRFDGPVSSGNPSSGGSPSWEVQPAGEASISLPNPSAWMPSRPFPDFSAWEAQAGAPQSVGETSPLPPSSYIIQTRNGYLRAREFLSHMKYSPEYPLPPIAPAEPEVPSKLPPMTGSKGGKGYLG